jgi:DNA-binding NarL/FixJ family response regulator
VCLSPMKAASQEGSGKANTQKEPFASVEEWRPDPGVQVARTIATRRGERDARYQQAVRLHEQGRSMKAIVSQLGISQRTVRHCPSNAFVDERIPKAVPEPG